MTEPLAVMRYGSKVGRAPPIRVHWCSSDNLAALEAECLAKGAGCDGEPQPCRTCGWTLCDGHRKAHAKSIAVPRKSFETVVKTVKRQLLAELPDAADTPWRNAWTHGRQTEWRAGNVVSLRPPTQIRYCSPPRGTQVHRPCVFGPATCAGPIAPCSWCGHGVCQRHAGNHRKALTLPPGYWNAVVQRYRNALEKAAKEGRGSIRVRPPELGGGQW